MPVCEDCNYKWTYGQTTIEHLRLRKGMRCPNCHEKQYSTKKSQAIDVIISLVLIFTLVTVKNMDQPSLVNIFYMQWESLRYSNSFALSSLLFLIQKPRCKSGHGRIEESCYFVAVLQKGVYYMLSLVFLTICFIIGIQLLSLIFKEIGKKILLALLVILINIGLFFYSFIVGGFGGMGFFAVSVSLFIASMIVTIAMVVLYKIRTGDS
ncbi:hypothetical protein X953_06045 [Virgibacillus sp. SK37]|nr:hypothetical protein X953_06045 [Virgibacillus sp. SK37]